MAASEAFEDVTVQSDVPSLVQVSMKKFVLQNGYLKEVPGRQWKFRWNGRDWLLKPLNAHALSVECEGPFPSEAAFRALQDSFNELYYSIQSPPIKGAPPLTDADRDAMEPLCIHTEPTETYWLDFEHGLEIDEQMMDDAFDWNGAEFDDEGVGAAMGASVVVDRAFHLSG